jgi:protein subunit release factor A
MERHVEAKAPAARDGWLRLDDAALLKQCDVTRHRASGPGGQRRNKVETAVRLCHIPSGVVVKAEESRSLEANRRRALRRLRERIAIEVRAPFDLAAPSLPEHLTSRTRDGMLAVNDRSAAYPFVVAVVLDAVKEAGGSYAAAARSLRVSTSQLIKFLQGDREIWRAIEEEKGA